MIMNFVAELTSVGILTIILIYYHKSVHILTRRNRWFSLSLWAAIAGCLINTLSIIAVSNAATWPLWLVYICNDMFFLFEPVMVILLCGYFANIIREESGREGENPLYIIGSIVVYVIFVAEVVINRFPSTPILYSFDENFNYIRGTGNASPIVIIAAYISLSIVAVLISWKRCTRRTKASLFIVLAVVAPLLVLQGLIPDIQLQGTAFTYSVLIVYLIYHNSGFEIDSVSGCMNRESFFVALNRFYRNSGPPAMIMVFFSNLRNINDDYGWRFGNNTIKTAGEYLMSVFGNDSVFMMTGTQFVVVVKDHDIMKPINEMRTHFSKDFEVGERIVKLNAKISVIDDKELYKKSGLVRILEYAYTTRLSGKSAGLVVCTDEIVSDFEKEVSAIARIRASIEARRFQMYYRPICNITEDVERITALAAYAVVRDEELGVLTIDAISDKLNSVDLTDELKFLVFEKACELQAKLRNMGHDNLQVAARFRIPMLETNTAYERIKDIITRTGADFRRVTVQLEQDWSARVVNDDLAAIIAHLRPMGLECSLRDIDYTYLKSALVAMPNHIILDTNAFRESQKDMKEASVLGTIAKMLRSNGIETVADNISTQLSLKDVKEHDIHYAMGDALFPMTNEAEILRILDRNRAAVNTNAWEGFNAQTTGLKFDL